MRLPSARHYRILSQAFFLLAFVALFWGLAEPRVPASVASILLALDPLTAIGTALSDWTVVGWTWLGLAVLALTAVLGRFFCGWICPLGTLQHVVSWIAGPERRKLPKINRYRRWFSIKYIILAVLLTWAALVAPPSIRLRHPTPVARWPLARRLGVLRPPRGHPPSVSMDAPILLPRCVSTWRSHGCHCAARSTQDPPR